MRDLRQTEGRRRVVVIGGGVSGLTVAYELNERFRSQLGAPEVLLVEASARLGGSLQTHRRDGFLLEGGPDTFISEKPEAVNLARRLGLESQLIGTNERDRRAFIVREGRLRTVPEGFQLLAPSRFWPFVTTDVFSWTGKARMALDLLLPKRAGASEADDESLAQFVRRRFGREALDRMAQPMVGGIYTADPEHLSLRATMPRFLDMERQHRSVIGALWKSRKRAGASESRGTSGARYGLFLSFAEGMQTLTDALAANLSREDIKLNTKVESLQRKHESWLLQTTDGETIVADAVCLALPAHAAARLLRDTDGSAADELRQIPYASTATVNLAYRREDIPHALNGFGFVVPYIERRALLACSFSSVKFAGRAPEGHVLLRAFVGGALQPEMFALSATEMISAVQQDLRELLGVTHPPHFTHVEKWPRSMAQYHLGHAERMTRLRHRLLAIPSLQLAGNYLAGAGIPDCIRAGTQAAEKLVTALTDK